MFGIKMRINILSYFTLLQTDNFHNYFSKNEVCFIMNERKLFSNFLELLL